MHTETIHNNSKSTVIEGRLSVADLYSRTTVTAAECDRVLGIGADLGKRLRAAGQYPVRVLPGLGRNYSISTADVLRFLGWPLATCELSAPDGSVDVRADEVGEVAA